MSMSSLGIERYEFISSRGLVLASFSYDIFSFKLLAIWLNFANASLTIYWLYYCCSCYLFWSSFVVLCWAGGGRSVAARLLLTICECLVVTHLTPPGRDVLDWALCFLLFDSLFSSLSGSLTLECSTLFYFKLFIYL